MAALFGISGAFSSPVGQRIERATDPALQSDDWMLILEICDMINESEEGPKDATKAIRKRLSGNQKNFKCILHTLTLIEACVKNCGTRFHKQVATKEFLSELTKFLSGQKKGQTNILPQNVQDKVLSLIQSWSDAFQHARELQQVKICYDSLKAQGYEFPAQNLDTLAPIFTPDKTESGNQPPPANIQSTRPRTFAPVPQPIPQSHQPGAPIHPNPEQMAKLRSELDIVERDGAVFAEMITEMEPGSENPDDYTLLVELNKTCREMQRRVVQLVDKIANEEVTGVLLRINDDLNNIFIRYDRYERNRNAVTGTPKESHVPAVVDSTTVETSNSDPTLINFDNSVSQSEEDKEFDMFAQSRSSTFADSRQCGSTYEDNRVGVPNEGSIADVLSAKGPYPPSAISQAPPTHTPPQPANDVVEPDDMADVEEWLKGTDLDQLKADEEAVRVAQLKANSPTNEQNSMSSSDFDKFLNDRAKNAPQPARQMSNLAGEASNDQLYGL